MPRRKLAKPCALLVSLAVCLGAAACTSSSSKSANKFAPGPKGVTVYSWKTSLGTVVGSIDGVVAYADTQEHGGTFACTGGCTTTWHPWTTSGTPVHAGPGVRASEIGTVARDGNDQITYGGHPLYLYAHSQNARQANAQGAGGVWYVVATNGSIVK
jgi:predicted lipoprotein with Yx(FWY)xxD motif